MGNTKQNSKFKEKVIKVVRMIPAGKVASYGQVALYVGMPRAAREVGWILNGLEEKIPVPWWRVINNKGRVSIKGSKYSAFDQKTLLIKDGVVVNADLTLDIEKYRFSPTSEDVEKMELDPHYLDMISDKLPYSK